MADNKKVYVIGVKVDSKEDYDRLMNEHSKESSSFFLIGIDFKGLFDGSYPDGYPCLVQYFVDQNPFGALINSQLREIVDAGYTVIIEESREE